MEYLIRVVIWLITVPGIVLAGFGVKETVRLFRHMKDTLGNKIFFVYLGLSLIQPRASYVPILTYVLMLGVCIIYQWKHMDEVRTLYWIKGFVAILIYIVCSLLLQGFYFFNIGSDVWQEDVFAFISFEILSIFLIFLLFKNNRNKKVSIVLLIAAMINIVDFICFHYAIIMDELFCWKYLLLTGATLRVILGYFLLDIMSLDSLENRMTNGKKVSDEETYEYYLRLEQAQIEVRKMYHDMKNHLMVLEKQGGDKENKYLQQLKDTLKKEEIFTSTGREKLDIFMFQFRQRADKENIKLDVVIEKGCLNFMSSKDLLTIFSNALDNAMEACMKLPKEERKIEIKAMYQYNNVLLSIKNPISPEIKNNLETMKKNKENHGLGIINMREAIEKNSGILSIQSENGLFQVSALFITKEN